jgi:hypothetical protein
MPMDSAQGRLATDERIFYLKTLIEYENILRWP